MVLAYLQGYTTISTLILKHYHYSIKKSHTHYQSLPISQPTCQLLLWTSSWLCSILLLASSTDATDLKGRGVNPKSLFGQS